MASQQPKLSSLSWTVCKHHLLLFSICAPKWGRKFCRLTGGVKHMTPLCNRPEAVRSIFTITWRNGLP
ncbi:hypothetical protein DUNSADRAFT_14909 [Dunaliella salina]|uniref:Secreted protein n=1 Tax=Dunaliella salina TaxID=3046 RepID=A0ABQ7G6I8_DUNSA|nr:hypothetical protein DUNSADRAFT_14909 [Dunaliella salina]|eukprot:KAF5830202.1 hypothetical protein DUNSADRAFT_14909 [Dunaliella salina]